MKLILLAKGNTLNQHYWIWCPILSAKTYVIFSCLSFINFETLAGVFVVNVMKLPEMMVTESRDVWIRTNFSHMIAHLNDYIYTAAKCGSWQLFC